MQGHRRDFVAASPYYFARSGRFHWQAWGCAAIREANGEGESCDDGHLLGRCCCSHYCSSPSGRPSFRPTTPPARRSTRPHRAARRRRSASRASSLLLARQWRRGPLRLPDHRRVRRAERGRHDASRPVLRARATGISSGVHQYALRRAAGVDRAGAVRRPLSGRSARFIGRRSMLRGDEPLHHRRLQELLAAERRH